MKITKELLLQSGFEERVIEGQTIYVKGHIALVYLFNIWLPCHYSYGKILSDRLYVDSMEELEALNG
ncbi:MAG: hypothetical protein IJL54_05240 [Prevotella sp.]|nr:hypothetical protein [Prevotella sp.]